MGCCISSSRKGSNTPDPHPTGTQYSWENKRPVDRSLLIISDEDGSVVGRLPGQINGRQFRIKDCRDATIMVLDHTDSVTVEKCVNCQIFIGPTKGSLYLRECTNCKCVVACQQFRARDCRKCIISLFTSTQPVIEASSKLNFSCFQCSYPQLKDQFESVGGNVFNNAWSNIHDFDRGLDENNWTLLAQDAPPIIDLPLEGKFSQVGISFESEKSLVPLTIGSRNKPDGEACLVVFFKRDQYEDKALEFTYRLLRKVVLGHTKKIALKTHEIQKLFPQDRTFHRSASKGSVILLEVCGDDCTNLCHDLLREEISDGCVYVSPDTEQGELDVQAFNLLIEISFTM